MFCSSDCLTRHIVLLFGAFVLLTSPSLPQSQPGIDVATPPPTFKSTVQVVLVDVSVTNSKDEPVTDLKQGQFQVFEDRKAQKIASFEEHAGVPDVPALSRMAHLEPNVFSNAPLVRAGETVNILLLDSLNTQMWDQSSVHAEMINYIKTVRSGTRMAIFTLSDRLRFVQGFTEDPALLMAAVNGKKSAGNPELSSLLQTSSEQTANKLLVSQMQRIGATTGAPEIQAAASSLQAFIAENTSSQNGMRASLTLQAINQLAMYLKAIPGRKNVIWFTGSFPLNTLSSDPNMLRDYGTQVANTANLLAEARVAIYPIGVGQMGLAPNAMHDASTPAAATGITDARTATMYQTQSLDTESTERAQNSASLEDLADNTGGQFFLNTNGFNDVLDRVVKTGTYYYTLTYSPTNRAMDGRARHIQIKVKGGKYKLAYRRGYYATRDFLSVAPKAPPKGDPLRPLMEHGTPDSTEILYAMKVASSTPQTRTPESQAAFGHAGENQKLNGDLTRYNVTFAIPPENLALDTSADGVHQGRIEVTLLAYDRDGIPVNWLVRLVQLRLPRELYQQAQVRGVGFNLDIDAPSSAVYLRSGVYDMESNRAGTMEIPIAAVIPTPAVVASTAPMAIPTATTATTTRGTDHPTLPGVAARADIAAPTNSLVPAPDSPAALALAAAKELETVDVPKYCSELATNQEHSASLAAACEFVLNLRRKLTNIICDRETKRYWTTRSWVDVGADDETNNHQRSDVVTVNVTYRDGGESYSNVRIDGKPFSGKVSELSGSWSHGEFATLLAAVFAPSSEAQFHYSKEEKLRSIPALMFQFKVAAQNNRLYFLQSRNEIWFPEYGGRIWVDARTSSLLRMELETAYMPDYPIRLTKDEIDYSNLRLGDGTSMVLPTNSKVLICGRRDNCARSVIKFTNWHKFRAKTNIVANPTN